MGTTVQPRSQTLPETSLTVGLTAEIMNDADTGESMLLTSTQPNQGDLQVVTVEQALAKVAEQRVQLDRIESLAIAYEAAQQQPASEPRTWTFTSSINDETTPVTCMQGCTLSHKMDAETPSHPTDVFCWTDADNTVTLPVDNTGTPEDYGILSSRITVEPFARTMDRRLPHAVVEIIDEHYIGGLDPDGLGVVINQLAGRLAALRRTRIELMRTRADYVARTEESE